MTEQQKNALIAKGPAIRDLIMLVILLVWLLYAVASVIQLFKSGAEVLDSLPPFWFWGIPIAPYTALYQPWVKPGGGGQPPDPDPPGVPA